MAPTSLTPYQFCLQTSRLSHPDLVAAFNRLCAQACVAYLANRVSPTPGSETYRGTAPFSEPEAQALRDFELAHHFVLSVYYHSYANIFIFPWAYIVQKTEDDDLFQVHVAELRLKHAPLSAIR